MKAAVLFPGQGAQYVGMGKDIYEAHATVRALYQKASEIVQRDLAKVCFEGPSSELTRTDVSQPAILTHSLALLSLWQIPKSVVAAAGLSLGEYTALVFAGALSVEDATRLVCRRGEWMQASCEQSPSGMVAILGLNRVAIEQALDSLAMADRLGVANVNAPEQIIISGAKDALEKAIPLLKAKGARRCMPLEVAGAFHSPLMKPAEERLAREIRATPMQQPRIPIVSNVYGRYLSEIDEIREALVRQLTSPVEWLDSMQQLIADGVETFYEIGPGKSLSAMLKRIAPSAHCISLETMADLVRES